MKHNYAITVLLAVVSVAAVSVQSVSGRGLLVPSLLGTVVSFREQGDVVTFTLSGKRSWLDGNQVRSRKVKDFSITVTSDARLDTYVPREQNGKYVPFVHSLSFKDLKQLISDAKKSGHQMRIDITEPKIKVDANKASLRNGMVVDTSALKEWLNKPVDTNRLPAPARP